MRTESSGKPDAWKLARPVWGWGRGDTPRPTPHCYATRKFDTAKANFDKHDPNSPSLLGWHEPLKEADG